MIKLLQCVRRSPGLSIAEFRGHWEEYRERVHSMVEDSGAVRFAINTTLVVEENMRIMLTRGTGQPYDGVVEIWWNTGAEVMEYLNKPETQERLARAQRYQAEFMDLEESRFFFVSEEEVFDREEP